MPEINEYEAPAGFIPQPSTRGCDGCQIKESSINSCYPCSKISRKDGCSVVFVKIPPDHPFAKGRKENPMPLTNPTTEPADPAYALLQDAQNIVTGARRQSYGNPEDNFKCIADLWYCYLRRKHGHLPGLDITATDVAAMMILLKTARLAETPDHKDSWMDIAGYAACGWRTVAPAPTIPPTRNTTAAQLAMMHDEAEARS